jgi:hypothetical protein
LGRQLSFELLLHCKLRRRPRHMVADGARVGGAEVAACDGGARVKPTSGGCWTRVVRRQSSRAAVVGRGGCGCGGARGCLQRRLGLGASKSV